MTTTHRITYVCDGCAATETMGAGEQPSIRHAHIQLVRRQAVGWSHDADYCPKCESELIRMIKEFRSRPEAMSVVSGTPTAPKRKR